jgi:hypothetical protein
MAAPDNKQGFLANLSPWSSRAATPKPPQTPRTTESGADDEAKAKEREAAVLGRQRGGDHVVDRRHRLSLKRYPQDCPPLAVRWYHAVDVPKRKPLSAHGLAPDASLPKAKKWIPFSTSDSAAIEAAFQKTADAADAAETRKGSATPTTPDKEGAPAKATTTKVSVNEDYLFDVEIETRELAPSFWLGPVYDVKRGTWFTTDGEAVDESLATQLEEGFLKVKPWRFGMPEEQRSASQPRGRPLSMGPVVGDDYRKELGRLNRDSTSNPVTPKTSFDSLRKEASMSRDGAAPDAAAPTASAPPPESPRTSDLPEVRTLRDTSTHAASQTSKKRRKRPVQPRVRTARRRLAARTPRPWPMAQTTEKPPSPVGRRTCPTTRQVMPRPKPNLQWRHAGGTWRGKCLR